MNLYLLRRPTIAAPAVVLLVAILLSCDDNIADPATSSAVRVDVTTTGQAPDTDGYQISIGAGAPKPAPNNGSVSFDPVTPGLQVVTIDDVADNCELADGPPRGGNGAFSIAIVVAAGETGIMTADVVCSAARP